MRWSFLPLLLSLAAPALADSPSSRPSAALWDPQKYIHVSEVRPGMTGYGLTVFSGTTIERFNVTVVDVIKNFRPQGDLILITSDNRLLLHSESIEGMSGSPIFLYDLTDTAHLHPRLAGAFAYAWANEKDPLAGVQPIEYMLDVPPDSTPATQPSAAATGATWNLTDLLSLPNANQPEPESTGPRLRPLATPVIASGLSHDVFRQIAPIFERTGLVLMEGGASGQGSIGDPNAPFEPGCALVVPLLTGDAELDAIGTCTDIRGNNIYGFGHPFNNEGPIALPMGAGRISAIVAANDTSFKLGSFTRFTGTLTADQGAGVAGILGPIPPMIPFSLHIIYSDGSLDQTYHFQMALHPKLTPAIVEAAVGAALGAVKDPPAFHTLDYDIDLDFGPGRSLKIQNTGVNGGSAEVFMQIGLPVIAALNNPFQQVPLRSVTGTVRVTAGNRSADITSVTIPHLKYAPGDQVKGFINYRPWRGEPQSMNLSFALPKDLPDGKYQVTIADSQRYLADQRQAEPFRFTAESIDELFSVVRDFESVRHDALYVRLIRQSDGVAVGHSAMPGLPSAARDVLLNSGRSDMTAFVSSTVWIIPTATVMTGGADFTLTISRTNRVESAKKPGPTTQPGAQP